MSYTPNDSPEQFFAEQAWLSGALLTGAGYGIVIALSWLCLQALWNRLKRMDANYRRNLFFLFYVCVMFVFGSLYLGSNSKFTQLAFINNRGYPGGPSQYEQQMFSISVDEVANVSFVLANWLADSLLVWRCVIIYSDFDILSGRIILVVTGLMQLASYVLGIFFLVQISSPSSSPYTNVGHSVNWTLPYFCVSLATNIVVTLLIVIRLLLYRRTVVRTLGPGHVVECTTIIAMLVESAAVYTVFSLLFLIPFAMNNAVSYTFLQVLGEAQLIAPLLIIYRETQGKGWISSASSVGTGTNHADRSIRIGRLTSADIRFASDLTYSQSTGTRTLEFASKRDSAGDVTVDALTGDGGRAGHETIELRVI